MVKRVLFLCTGNSCRSQMAEGLLRTLGGERFIVESAGTSPSKVNPFAIRAMSERGIDISSHVSKSVESLLGNEYDYIITVCDNAARNCPAFPGNASRMHWNIVDPADSEGSEEELLRIFCNTRNIVEAYVRLFISKEKDHS